MLSYPAASAGGIMTTQLVKVTPSNTVADARDRLRAALDHAADIDNVSVIDGEGRLVDEVTLFELAIADPSTPIQWLVGPPWPITVAADASLPEVVERLVDNRRSSIVVLDDDGRPVGRILADDLIDALVSGRGRLRFPRVVE
jgi:Mg/Co/Ni transporter MgtE